MEFETSLPRKERLNHLLSVAGSEPYERIASIQDSQANSDVIAIEDEFNSFKQLTQREFTARLLTELVFEDSSEETLASVYRGVTFADQLVMYTFGPGGSDPEAYFEALYDADNYYLTLSREVDKYLSENTHIEGIIFDYVEILDEGRGRLAQVRYAAGLMCMLAERERGKAIVLFDDKHAYLDDSDEE